MRLFARCGSIVLTVLLVSILAGAGSAFALESLFPDPVMTSTVEPWEIAGGDFDHDGHADFVATGFNDFALRVFFGNGDGSFAHTDLAARFPRGVVVADFNGDGHEDLAAAASGTDRAVVVFLGHGDRTFEPGVLYPLVDFPTYVSFGDLDNDDHLDLVVTNSSSGALAVLLGRGDGTFDAALYSGSSAGLGPAALADFDGDGKLDAVAANRRMLGNGDGTFDPFVLLTVGSGPRMAAAGDFDDDGNADLAVTNNGTDDVSVLLGHGDGTFASQVRYAVGDSPADVRVVDLDADGVEDLVIGRFWWPPHVSVLRGAGDGTFAPYAEYPTPHTAWQVETLDFDEDGMLDLAVASFHYDTVMLLQGCGDGSFESHGRATLAAGDRPAALVLADLDADGDLDLAVANRASNDVTLLLGNGAGGFTAAAPLAAGAGPTAIAAGHLDADRKLDLVVANRDSSDLSVWRGSGGGAFGPEARVALGAAPLDVALGHFNGDALTDLAVVTAAPANGVMLLFGDDPAGFVAGPSLAIGTDSSSLAIADLDGDLRDDLVVTATGGPDLSILLGLGAGAFAPEMRFDVDGATAAAIADLDGDGLPDVVAGSFVLYGEADENAPPAWGLGSPTHLDVLEAALDGRAESTSLAIADMNGDARPDLVARHLPFASVLLADGHRSFRFGGANGLEDTETDLAVGDLDGDGRADLALSATLVGGVPGGKVTILLNQGPVELGFGSGKTTLGWPPSCAASSYNVYRGLLSDLADGDGDGRPDAGWGTCQNASDTNPSDNDFADPENPPPGDGFYYLIAAVGPAGEGDLGTTSSGVPRVPAIPCAP